MAARKKHRKRKGTSGTSWQGTAKGRVHVAGYHVPGHYRKARRKKR